MSSSASSESDHMEIPEEEQWRLINESGILKQAIPPQSPGPASERSGEERILLADEIFNTAILAVPFSFLLLMMEMHVFVFALAF
jgi:MoxR-like ATPase